MILLSHSRHSRLVVVCFQHIKQALRGEMLLSRLEKNRATTSGVCFASFQQYARQTTSRFDHLSLYLLWPHRNIRGRKRHKHPSGTIFLSLLFPKEGILFAREFLTTSIARPISPVMAFYRAIAGCPMASSINRATDYRCLRKRLHDSLGFAKLSFTPPPLIGCWGQKLQRHTHSLSQFIVQGEILISPSTTLL